MATTKVSKGLIKDEAITIEKLNNALVVTEAKGIVNNNNDITVPTSAAVKDYVDSSVVGGLIYQGSYDASTNTPVLDSRGTQIAVTQGWTYTVTVDGTFYGEVVKVGDVLISETDLTTGTGALTDWTTVQSNIDLATAGTDATAIRGLAGFDEDNFTVANGFVNLKVGDVIPSNIVQSIVSGGGITVDNTDPANPIVTNSAPDQTVVLTEGDNVTIIGTYPNFTIAAADAPAQLVTSVNTQVGAVVLDTDNISEGSTNLYDKTVVITGSGGATVTGTYPNFNINTTDEEGVESVTATGIGINVNNTDPANPIISNTLPDQTVVITGSGGAIIEGTYPNFNIDTTDAIGVDNVLAGTSISIDNTDPANPIVNNTNPDQTVVLNQGNNITITGTYPNFTISSADSLVDSVNGQTGVVVLNTDNISEGATNLYDKTVVLTGSGSTTVTGTYPNFNIESVGNTYTAGTGLELNGTVFSNTAPDQTVAIAGGGSTSISGTYPNFTVTSTDTVYTAGSGLALTGTEFSNTAPDQTVTITGAGDAVVTGTYPNFTVTSTSDPIPTVLPSDFVFFNVKNETGSTINVGTGCMAVGTDGNSGHILIAPFVADGSIEPKYFMGVLDSTIANGELGKVVSLGVIDQINLSAFNDGNILWCDPVNPGDFTVTEPTAPNIKIAAAIVLNSSTNGKLLVRVQGNEGLHELHDVGITSQTDKQALTWNDALGYWENTNITNSTTGGNSTFINTSSDVTTGDVTITSSLNATGTPSSTTFLRGDNTWAEASLNLQEVTDIGNTTTNSITIESLFLNDASTSNGVIYYDNVEDRVTLANYNVGGSVYVETNGGTYVAKFNSDTSTELTGSLTVGGSATANSFISNGGTSSDFLKADGSLDSNSYALAGNYITSLTGEATASGPGSAAVTLTNSAVIGKTISGVNITGGTISATDTIVTAFGKLQNQINGLVGSTKYEGVWNASTNTPTITSGSGTDGSYYIVNVAGSTNIDGISSWNVGDWIIYHDATWQKVDNTDAVVSVNGETGAVSLTTSNITEGTNLYYTDARVDANSNVSANTAARHSAVTLGTTNGLSLSGQQISLGLSSSTTTGALSSADWISFNDKTDNVGTVTSVTVNSGSGLSGSGTVTSTGTITLSHADTSTQASVDNTGATVIQDVTLDTYGHVTGLASKTITLGDLGYTGATNANYITNNNQLTNGAGYTTNVGDITGVTAGSGISGGGTSGTVTINHADTSAQGSINNSGATVIQDVTLDTYGHVTGLGSKTITLADLGYTGATNANYITNNNQLTNGAGYTTNVGDITGVTAGSYLTGGGTSGTVTVNANATTASTGSTLVARDTSGDINVRLLRSEYDSTNASIGYIMTQVDTASNNYVRPSTPAQFRAAVTDGYYTNNVGDITGVTAGTNLTGGGSSGAVTLNLDDEISLSRANLYTGLNFMGDYMGTYYGSIYTDYDGLRFGVLSNLPPDGRYGNSMLLDSGSDLHVAGDVIAYSSTLSDERLKDNIQTIDGALDKIESLRGVTYTWNKGSREGQKDIGLIAQEVEKVLPEIVREKKMNLIDGETYKTVDYEKIIGVLIESVKELSAKIKTLETKIQ